MHGCCWKRCHLEGSICYSNMSFFVHWCCHHRSIQGRAYVLEWLRMVHPRCLWIKKSQYCIWTWLTYSFFCSTSVICEYCIVFFIKVQQSNSFENSIHCRGIDFETSYLRYMVLIIFSCFWWYTEAPLPIVAFNLFALSIMLSESGL